MLQSLLVFAMLFTEFFNEVDDYSTTSANEQCLTSSGTRARFFALRFFYFLRHGVCGLVAAAKRQLREAEAAKRAAR